MTPGRNTLPRRLLHACVLALALVIAFPASAGDGDGRRGDHRHGHPPHGPMQVPEGVVVPDWDELTPEQQKLLVRLKDEWDTLPASRRVQALEHAQRRARWEAMSPEQRERIRKGMRNYRDLSPAQRQQMREAMRVMRGLPAEERQALADKWRSLDPEQRRAWLETGGPGISPAPDAKAD
ncbi:DUF3106 domain-containing protein [Arenimonas donghaensis]|uniref:DUF3106 domain-containing protein n=1 Tax=Arenimonas donghaensis DSM 18148 = HO3-R19 TaxID=1121014 RepID=A0A087MIQ7_9GAMM|nr:DUF3106 domain-containing protein [Arenimonas donghaensis]KFL36760.1 hypothetical protein N788_03880 [Arenimonas donghaensis DSM 18148 = HO3-R19]